MNQASILSVVMAGGTGAATATSGGASATIPFGYCYKVIPDEA